jgi:hypothetical protein
LPYLADASATLRNLASHLKTGSVIAVMEFDASRISTTPESQLFQNVCHWMTEAFGTSIDPRFGSSLAKVFRGAGLPWPHMMSWQKTCCGPDGFYGWLADLIRAVLPHVVRLGLASAEEIDVDTLEGRMRGEAVTRQLAVYGPRWVGAWTRIP